MRVVTAHTMREIDRRAIDDFGISSLSLMEQAGRGCVDAILSEFGRKGRAVIIAGKGNNGGDGFVIARLLAADGWDAEVCVMAEHQQISGDAAHNLKMLPDGIVRFCPRQGQLASAFLKADVIVDALLGTGLDSDVDGVYREAVDMMNASGRPVLSVDIPSGIHGTTGRVLGDAVRASITVTFAFAKLGHLLYPGAEHTGRLVIADIGIPELLMTSANGYDFLNEDYIRPMLKRRNRRVHKGDCGHCFLIAGSSGKTGAAALSANSAVRAGAGLVTLGVPESIHQIIEIKTTEAMTTALPDSGGGYLADAAFPVIEKLMVKKDAVAIGPGLGRQPGTVSLVHTIVENVSLPLVIDADGLFALAEDISVLRRKKSADVVLTPHPGEMARLLGTSIPDVDAIRISIAQEFARNYGVYLVLKGARTIIASPAGFAAINGSGNPGMATGGMGDVLTGILVSLIGQGYSAWDACLLGVFLHGYAADLVAMEKGEIGMCATDVQEKLPFAFSRLFNKISSPL